MPVPFLHSIRRSGSPLIVVLHRLEVSLGMRTGRAALGSGLALVYVAAVAALPLDLLLTREYVAGLDMGQQLA